MNTVEFIIGILILISIPIIFIAIDSSKTNLDEQEIADLIYQEINEYRLKNNLLPLEIDQTLVANSILHSEWMSNTSLFFHSEGQGYGENIIYVQIHDNVQFCKSTKSEEAMAECMVKHWRYSTPHLMNIITRSYTHTGIGVNCQGIYGGDRVCYATQQFR